MLGNISKYEKQQIILSIGELMLCESTDVLTLNVFIAVKDERVSTGRNENQYVKDLCLGK